jgi:pimeloyl-ACP methyl ester carboxylesterase
LLHVDVIEGASPTRTALIAHGILGSGRNWRSFARKLVAQLPNWQVLLVDQRCHGKTSGMPGPHTLQRCADDLQEVAEAWGGVEVAIGHSFGGKVVCTWLRNGGDLRQVWVLDSPPSSRPLDPQEVDALGVIAAVRALPLPCDSRDQARTVLTERGLPAALVAWLLTSLVHRNDGWWWVWDLDGVDAMIADYLRTDLTYWATNQQDCAVEWVQAANSDRWTTEDLATMAGLHARSNSTHHLLLNAGHWLHVDNAAGTLALLLQRWTL